MFFDERSHSHSSFVQALRLRRPSPCTSPMERCVLLAVATRAERSVSHILLNPIFGENDSIFS